MKPAPSTARDILALLGFVALPLAAGAAGALFTVHAIPTWYAALAKPPFNPPNTLFGPVWTVLYLLIGVAAWLIWRLPASPGRRGALTLWWVQLLVNALWTPIFFGGHQLLGGLITILVLDTLVVLTVARFLPLSRLATALLFPYLVWILFATTLNEELYRLNRNHPILKDISWHPTSMLPTPPSSTTPIRPSVNRSSAPSSAPKQINS